MALTRVPGSQIKDESIESADVKDGTIVNADINVSAAIEVSKLASVESTIIGRKTGGTANIHMTKMEGRALLGVENPVDYVITLPISYGLSDKGKMAICDNILYVWNGIIWEERILPTWHKRIGIPARAKASLGSTSWRIPLDSEDNLPLVGFYQVDAFLNFVEWVDPPSTNTANCLIPQTLSIKGSGNLNNWVLLDKSGAIGITPVGDQIAVWYNFSLQGSAIIRVDDLNGDLSMQLSAVLPNSAWDEIIGGYVHIEYLGNNEGVY